MPNSRLFLASVLAVAASVMDAQQAPRLQLAPPIATADAEFTKVIAAHELTPGRLLVADERERTLTIVDFTDGTSRKIGRVGSGPGEFRSIGSLLPRARGGAYVADFALRRLLPILPDGTIGDPILNPAVSLQFESGDSIGRLYGNNMIFRDRKLSDSMNVVRWDITTGKVDTILTFDAGRSGMIIPAGAKRRVWYSTTSWTVLADGSLLLLDAATYRMSRWNAGMVRPVASLPFESRPVTQADRDAFAEAQKDVKPIQLGQAGTQASAPPPRPESIFPATFPAFEADTRLLRAADGTIWLNRLVSPRDATPVVDVIAPEGRLLGQLRLPARSRLAAFSEGFVYLIVADANDVERVRRYAYPAVPRR